MIKKETKEEQAWGYNGRRNTSIYVKKQLLLNCFLLYVS